MDSYPDDFSNRQPSRYLKLKEAVTSFRILSPAIAGWEYWDRAGNPRRLRECPQTTPTDIRFTEGKPERVKFFWAFVVYNITEKTVQIAEITQKSVREGISEVVRRRGTENLSSCIFTVHRTGSGLETKYTVSGVEDAPVPSEVTEEYKRQNIKLEALFDGENPFGWYQA